LTRSGFETAALPTTPEAVRKRILNFAIVGGGRKLFSLGYDIVAADMI
jgi:hypothetical protein